MSNQKKLFLPYDAPAELFSMFRQRSELTTRQLAELVGYKDERMIQLWESGARLPTPERLQRLLEIYFQRKVFTSGQEILEAQQLWQSVKNSYDANEDKYKSYPAFDTARFEQLYLTRPVLTSKISIPPPALHNLPANLTSFIGRKDQIADLLYLLKRPDRHLITLLGTAGVGKTRLALELAGIWVEQYQNPTFFVELADLFTANHVLSAIARALNIQADNERELLEAVKVYCQKQSLLLILDNFEHLLSAKFLLQKLLKTVPSLKILVTSRHPLNLYGEQLFQVPNLNLPPSKVGDNLIGFGELAANESLALLLERIRLKKPDFELSSDNVEILIKLCLRLEGLPLALELIAAQLKSTIPKNLLAELDGFADFGKLNVGHGYMIPRHSGLFTALEWSYQLLNRPEQNCFIRLSIFASSWTIEAARALLADEEGGVLLLDRLIAHNLAVEYHDNGTTRYRYHEAVSQFAAEHLDLLPEKLALYLLHARYYSRLVEDIEPELNGSEQVYWYKQLETDYPNIRLALQSLTQQEKWEEAAKLAAALRRFWWVRGYFQEGREWLERLIKLKEQISTSAQAKLLTAAATIALAQNDYQSAYQYNRNALKLYFYLHDKYGQALTLHNLAACFASEANNLLALKYYTLSLKIFREIQDTFGTQAALGNLANVHRKLGHLSEAEAFAQESLALARTSGNLQLAARALNYLGLLAYEQHSLVKANALQIESLALRFKVGDKGGVAECLEQLAAIANRQSSQDYAVQLYGLAEKWREENNVPLLSAVEYEYQQSIAEVRATIGDDEFRKFWHKGRNLDFNTTIANIFAQGFLTI